MSVKLNLLENKRETKRWIPNFKDEGYFENLEVIVSLTSSMWLYRQSSPLMATIIIYDHDNHHL